MGKLYLIPTPVGNMEDITLRALRLLKEVDLVLAEDTRTSAKLLKHYEITTPLLSHHKFNEHQQVDRIAERLERGEMLAGSDCFRSGPGQFRISLRPFLF